MATTRGVRLTRSQRNPRARALVLGTTTATLFGLGLVCGPRDLPAAPNNTIAVWTRAPGAYGGDGDAPARLKVREIDPRTLVLQSLALSDPQYGKQKKQYRGVWIRDLIAAAPPENGDLALLHFDNLAMVPFPIGPRSPKAFLALDVWSDERREFVPTLPAVFRQNPYFEDRRPIIFGSNKAVVEDGAHPDLSAAAKDVFSPWAQVDSLVGIEYVDGEAYYRQFDVSDDPNAKEGLAVFRGNCQFCHGVRGVGAQFGWDFVDGISERWRRTPPLSGGGQFDELYGTLYQHVRTQPADAPARGLRMPALRHLDEKQVVAVWVWLRSVAAQPLRPYQPRPNMAQGPSTSTSGTE